MKKKNRKRSIIDGLPTDLRAVMEEIEKYKNLDVTAGILRLLSNQIFQVINNLPEENVHKIDIDSQSVLETGAEQFQSLIFETMSDEESELYRRVKKFIKEKQS